MKNRVAAALLAAALLILAVLLLIWIFSDNRVQMHTLPPEFTQPAPLHMYLER